jgi:hypothetical protein
MKTLSEKISSINLLLLAVMTVIVLSSSYCINAQTIPCPGIATFTINHVAGTVAPVTKTVFYGTITNIPGEPAKCWITQNLGATHQAPTVVSDATEESAGWYWQFNRKQGYKHDGNDRTPNSTWDVTDDNLSTTWEAAKDPCTIELGAGWRIPTSTEWTNVDASGNWTNWNGAYGSGLKLHAAGSLSNSDGHLAGRGSHGNYWSSTQYEATYGSLLDFASGWSYVYHFSKAYGFSVRCLRDVPNLPTNTTVIGSVTNTVCYNATQTITVAGGVSAFSVQTGGSATMIAGQNILYYPGTTVHNGGYMWGYIAPTGPYCVTPSTPAVITSQEEPSIGIEQSSFKVYPNPTTRNFILEFFRESLSDKITVDVYGMWGEKVLTEVLNGEHKHEFSLSNRPVGVYFIRVISGDKVETTKIIKQ